MSLSMHCLFEGMGCGLQRTQVAVWNLFIMLSAHEWVEAFSLGLQLTKYYNVKGVLVGSIVYSLMTPFGIIVGTVISESHVADNESALINGILKVHQLMK